MVRNDTQTSPNACIAQDTALIGTMTGTITPVKGGAPFQFNSNNLFRRTTPEGRLQVFGLMRHQDADFDLRVEFQLADKNAPSGDYVVGNDAVSKLFIHYMSPLFELHAATGTITFHNHAPDEVKINGRLKFTTSQDPFEVDVIFEATGER